MDQISGEMEAGEAQKTLSKILARQRGTTWRYNLLTAAFVTFSMMSGIATTAVLICLPDPGFLSPLNIVALGIATSAIVYFVVLRRYLVRRFKEGMTDRGLKVRWTQSVQITNAHLVLESGGIVRTADWSAVTELFKVGDYWIFLVFMDPWFLPIRFFPNLNAQKEFVRLAISHLGEDARLRSNEAVRFAEDVA